VIIYTTLGSLFRL